MMILIISSKPLNRGGNMDYLVDVLRKEALIFDPVGFKLRSGETSHYYVDCRKLLFDSRHLWWIIQRFQDYIDHIHHLEFCAIGGPALGAAPLVSGLLMAYRTRNLTGFLVRKESKDHGLEGRIAGALRKHQQCIIVEDVVTSGQSLLDSIDAVEAFGARVIRAFCVVDRLQGCRKKLDDRGIPFVALTTIDDLIVND